MSLREISFFLVGVKKEVAGGGVDGGASSASEEEDGAVAAALSACADSSLSWAHSRLCPCFQSWT